MPAEQGLNPTGLMLRDPPYEGESLPGFLLGLAALNSVRDEWAVLGAVQSSRPSTALAFDLPRQARARLAELVGVDPAHVDAMSLATRAAAWADGSPVAPPASSCFCTGKRTRYCPCCVTELVRRPVRGRVRIPHLNWWAAYGAAICPEHGVWLLDRCRSCARPADIATVISGQCRCGCLYGGDGAPAGEELVAAQRCLCEALEHAHAGGRQAGGLDAGAYLHLVVLLRPVVINALRTGWRFPDTPCPPRGGPERLGGACVADRGSTEEDGAAAVVLHRALGDLPGSWGAFLESCRGMSSRYLERSERGATREFGPVLSRLHRLDPVAFDTILAATDAYLDQQWAGGINLTAWRRDAGGRRVTPGANLTDAARALGTSRAAVRQMVRQGRLKGQLVRYGERWYASIDPTSLRRETGRLAASRLTAPDAARTLGVARKCLEALAAEGLVEVVAVGDRRAARPCLERSVTSLLARVAGAVEAPRGNEPADVSWARLRRRAGAPTPVVVRAVLQGGLTGTPGARLADLRVTEGSARIVQERCRDIAGNPVNVTEAAGRLGVCAGTLRSMVRTGFIVGEVRGGRSYFREDALQQFRRQFVTVPDAAGEAGIPRSTLRRWVRFAVVRPAWGGGARRVCLYRRRDIAAVISGARRRRDAAAAPAP